MSAMAHESARDLASAWVDGELSGPDLDRLERHLAGCAECSGHVTAMHALPPLLQALPRIEPSPGLAAAIVDRLPLDRRTGAARRTQWLAWRLVPVVVAAVVLAIVAGVALRPGT